MMDKDKYNVLLEVIRETRQEVASIDRDLIKDRQDMQDFRVRLATLEESVKQMRQALNVSAERIKDKVTEAVEPMQKDIKNLNKNIKQKRAIIIRPRIPGFIAWLFKIKKG